MTATSTKVHQKLISFPDPIYQQIMLQVKRTGLSFSEFIRYMALNQTTSFYLSDEVEVLNEKESKSVAKGVADIKAGRYITIKTPQQLKKYLDSIK